MSMQLTKGLKNNMKTMSPQMKMPLMNSGMKMRMNSNTSMMKRRTISRTMLSQVPLMLLEVPKMVPMTFLMIIKP